MFKFTQDGRFVTYFDVAKSDWDISAFCDDDDRELEYEHPKMIHTKKKEDWEASVKKLDKNKIPKFYWRHFKELFGSDSGAWFSHVYASPILNYFSNFYAYKDECQSNDYGLGKVECHLTYLNLRSMGQFDYIPNEGGILFF